MAQMPDLNVVCKNCGNEVSPYITECPYCGNRLRKRAPKIERDGTVSEPRKARKAPQAAPRRGCRASARARSPASAASSPARPYATIALVVLSLFGYLLLFPVALVDIGGRAADRRPVVAGRDLALPLREHLVRAGRGHRHRGLRLAARAPPRAARRSLGLFVLCGMGGIALAVAVDPTPLAIGGNGAALGLLCAWAVPDLMARSRGEEYDGDLLGTAVFAAVLLLMPLAVVEASAIAGFAGGAAGLLVGLVLARARIA